MTRRPETPLRKRRRRKRSRRPRVFWTALPRQNAVQWIHRDTQVHRPLRFDRREERRRSASCGTHNRNCLQSIFFGPVRNDWWRRDMPPSNPPPMRTFVFTWMTLRPTRQSLLAPIAYKLPLPSVPVFLPMWPRRRVPSGESKNPSPNHLLRFV